LTLLTLHFNSNQAAFLGDPNFPEVAIMSSKGAKIRLYESLYTQYSRLQFSRLYDRPMAIAGLEQRLVSAFKTHGGYGVFDGTFFRRSLLWKRDASVEQEMKEIDFPPEKQYRVPTWSWMAYQGAITFMDVPFDGVQWEHEGRIQSPWTPSSYTSSSSSSSSSSAWHTGNSSERIDLMARARDLVDLALAEGKIIYDRGTRPAADRMVKCVVVGIEKPDANMVVEATGLKHYVLIVAPRLNHSGGPDNMYERVGVGSLPGNWISKGGQKIHIF
jgi:hypothetical protein